MDKNRLKQLAAVSLLALAVPFSLTNAQEPIQNRDTFTGAYNEVFSKAYTQYKTLNSHKAFALAVDTNKNWAYGLGHSYAVQNDANRRALFECNARIKKFKVNAQCRLYATEEKIVW